jgi:hypothetical protein
METELRTFLLSVAAAYAAAGGCALSTVARRCRNDSSFFERIADPQKSFTARTFDEVMAWFDQNWPDGKERPYALLKWVAESKPRIAGEAA